MAWSTDGRSFGVAKNKTFSSSYDYVFASVTDRDGKNGCSSLLPGEWCGGAAWYDVSDTDATPSITWSWNPDFEQGSDPENVDVAAVRSSTLDTVLLLRKNDSTVDGELLQHQVAGTGNDSYGAMAHLSRVEWLDTEYFVATEAGSTDGSADGELVLGKRLDTGFTPVEASINSGGVSKPEGVSVVRLTTSNRGTYCNSDAEYLVYVGDYENSRMYLYWIDLDSGQPATINAQNVGSSGQNWISLDNDRASTASLLGGPCEPSTVRYHQNHGDTFVLCQTRNSIIRVDTTTELCDPQWYAGTNHEVRLKMQDYPSDTSTPTCSTSPSVADCSSCSPHTIEYDPFIREGAAWVFVGLTGKGQISAITTDLSRQRIVYRGSDCPTTSGQTCTFEPLDFVILPSCDPNDQTCVYP